MCNDVNCSQFIKNTTHFNKNTYKSPTTVLELINESELITSRSYQLTDTRRKVAGGARCAFTLCLPGHLAYEALRARKVLFININSSYFTICYCRISVITKGILT